MPKPRKAVRPIEKTINLPETLVVQVDLILWSELEQRVPHGAWARYVQNLIEADIACRALLQENSRKMMQGAA
jgi:hypothetical protein